MWSVTPQLLRLLTSGLWNLQRRCRFDVHREVQPTFCGTMLARPNPERSDRSALRTRSRPSPTGAACSMSCQCRSTSTDADRSCDLLEPRLRRVRRPRAAGSARTAGASPGRSTLPRVNRLSHDQVSDGCRPITRAARQSATRHRDRRAARTAAAIRLQALSHSASSMRSGNFTGAVNMLIDDHG